MLISLLFGFVIVLFVFGFTGFRILPALIAGIVIFVLDYMYLPVLRYDFAAPWVIAFTGFFCGCFVAAASEARRESKSGFMGCMLTGVGLVVFFLVMLATTSPIFHATAYADLIGKVDTVPFEQAMQRLDLTGHGGTSAATVIDQSDVRLEDSVLAERRAQELLGKDPEFGGTYVLGEMQLTRRNGRLTWAAPLEFSGFLRWLSAGDGSPAYLWVDAHDAKQSGLVKSIEGKPLHMRCIDSSWMGDNIARSIRSQGFQSTGMDDYSFELDDHGHPQYVVTTYAHRVGFSGLDATGVVVFDPETCHAVHYALDAIPAWVNRAVPASMVMEQIADWGAYSKGGWWNASFGAHKDVQVPTPGIELVSTARGGDTAWYVGVSTSGNPNGTTGFMLVDSRNKKATFFEQAGATEQGARNAIIGKIAEKIGYTTTWPILYNIGGRATYLTTLKDGSGNFKGIGLMPVDDRGIVVVADDLRRALILYQQALAGQAVAIQGVGGNATDVIVDGVVLRAVNEVIDGNTIYYFMVDGHPGVFLTATNRLGPQVALTSKGDQVSITASGDPASGSLTVMNMVNAGLAVKPPAPALDLPH